MAAWYDSAGRRMEQANYGTNGSSAFTRPNNSNRPATDSSDDVIVQTTSYGPAGQVFQTITNDGTITRYAFDAMGRLTKKIENDVNGAPSGGVMDRDRTTVYTYTAASRRATITAVDPNADGNTLDNQTTSYVYSGELSSNPAPVASNTNLRAVIYPDSDDTAAGGTLANGTDGVYDRIEMTYNADGSMHTREDQRQVALTFAYDDMGHRTSQTVTSGTVSGDQEIAYTYNDLGQPATVTSYSDQGQTVTSEVTYTYDGFGQLETGEQDHKPAGGYSNGTPTVIYHRDDTTGDRLDWVQYPNGRKLHTLYDTGIDADISRPSGAAEDDGSGGVGSAIVKYRYLGLSNVVVKDYPTPKVRLDRAGNTSGQYAGLDRFGRVIRQRWERYDTNGQDTSVVFDTAYGYDRASDRTYADNSPYPSASKVYQYDGLHRLSTYKQGQIKTDHSGIQSDWTLAGRNWHYDQLGNQTSVDFKGAASHVQADHNAANQITAYRVKANQARPPLISYQFNDSSLSSRFTNVGPTYDSSSIDAFDINTSIPDKLTITAVDADTFNGHAEQEPRTLVLMPVSAPLMNLQLYLSFPTGAVGEAGLVFGYKNPNDYWINVINKSSSGHSHRVYHVVNGQKTLIYETAGGSSYIVSQYQKWRTDGFYQSSIFPNGFPSGRVGFYSNTAGVSFDSPWPGADAITGALRNRSWPQSPAWGNLSNVGGIESGALNPGFQLLKGVRTPDGTSGNAGFQATFSITMTHSNAYAIFALNATFQDNFDFIRFHDGYTDCYQVHQGGPASWQDGGSTPALSLTQKNWVRVFSHGQTVSIKIIPGQASAPTEAQWSSAAVVFTVSNLAMTGGQVGFCSGVYTNSIDDLTLKTDRDGDGTYETTERVENFTTDANNYVPDTFEYDAAGNLTYDGVYQYTYDAWNRLIKVQTAYRVAMDDSSGGVTLGAIQLGSVVCQMRYDGQGRRIEKKIENSADLNCTYEYYYKGQSLIEVRNGSDQVIKQYVWSNAAGGYIDDLIQIAVNNDPTDTSEQQCETKYFALQGPNYDVWGIIDNTGTLVERYTYSPYGKRQVFFSPGTNDPENYAPALMSRRVMLDGTPGIAAPYGLCPFGHQGLMHDEAIDLIYNRAREYNPALGRFMQRDPLGYVDGMSLYEYEGSRPVGFTDAYGLSAVTIVTDAFIDKSDGMPFNKIALGAISNNKTNSPKFSNSSLWASTWIRSPYEVGTYYRTDSRHAGESGTSRAKWIFSIDTSNVGHMTKSVATFKNSATVQMRIYLPIGNNIFFQQVITTFNAKKAIFHRTVKVSNSANGCESTIIADASGGDPFTNILTPQLGLNVKIHLQNIECKKTRITIEVRHDDFPDYEIIVNDKLMKHYDASASGYGIYSLFGSPNAIMTYVYTALN